MKACSVKRKLEPEQPKCPPVLLESLEDIAWELWLLIELLAPVRRRLPNTASQKLVDYVKDRLIAKSVALAKWKKARPELCPEAPIRARDVLPGENWTFPCPLVCTGRWCARHAGTRAVTRFIVPQVVGAFIAAVF